MLLCVDVGSGAIYHFVGREATGVVCDDVCVYLFDVVFDCVV